MTAYFILGGILLIGLIFSGSKQFSAERNRKTVFRFLIAVLIFVACFRAESVGKDTHNYVRLFHLISNLGWKDLIAYSRQSGYEIGYVIYNRMLSLISTNGQIVTFANSLIFMLLVYTVTQRECGNPIFGLYVFYTVGIYQAGFNIVSSIMATYIVYLGIDAIRERKLSRYAIYVLIASTFHSAAIVMLVLYFMYPIRINIKRIFTILLIGIVSAFFLPRYINVLASIIPAKYVRYLSKSSDNGMILLFHLLIFSVILVIQTADAGNIGDNNDDDIRIHMWAFILEIVVLLMSLRIEVFTRLAFFFMPSLPILIDRVSDKISLRGNRSLLVIGLATAIGLQYVIRLLINNIGGSIPYVFFF